MEAWRQSNGNRIIFLLVYIWNIRKYLFFPLPVQRRMCKYTHKPGRKLKSSVTFSSLSKLKHSAETAVFLRHLQQGHLGFHEFNWLTLPSHETLPLTWPCHSTRTNKVKSSLAEGWETYRYQSPHLCTGKPVWGTAENFKTGGLFPIKSQDSFVTKQNSF